FHRPRLFLGLLGHLRELPGGMVRRFPPMESWPDAGPVPLPDVVIRGTGPGVDSLEMGGWLASCGAGVRCSRLLPVLDWNRADDRNPDMGDWAALYRRPRPTT